MSQAIWYNQWTLKKFSKYIVGDILEVGCGIGNFTKDLTKYGPVWAFDINKNHIATTIKKVKGKVQVGIGDIETGNYFFKNRQFDSIICLNVLEHIQNDRKAVANLYKLLKPNGYLCLLVPANPFLMGEIDKAIGHFRRYNLNQLITLLGDNQFKIILQENINFLGAIGWWWAGKVLKNKQVGLDKMRLFNFFAPLFLSIEDKIGTPIGTSILIVAQKKT